MEIGNPFVLGKRSWVTKHCRRGPLHYCECWLRQSCALAMPVLYRMEFHGETCEIFHKDSIWIRADFIGFHGVFMEIVTFSPWNSMRYKTGMWPVWLNGRGFARDPKGRGFESRPVRFQVTTLGKLLTRMCLCRQAVFFWYWPMDALRLGR